LPFVRGRPGRQRGGVRHEAGNDGWRGRARARSGAHCLGAGGFGGGGAGGTSDSSGGGGGGGGSYVNPALRDVLESADFNGTATSFVPLDGYVVVGLQLFAYTGGVVEYTIPQTAFYFVSAIGAQGGISAAGKAIFFGGYGAGVGGEVYLTQGTELDIVVGGAGAGNFVGGGGGGSFVWDPTAIPPQPAIPEPSTWAMMLIGFAGLGYASYRKTKLG
jgi:PEP-CTERM motif